MFARSFAKTLRSFSTRAVGKTESKTSIYTIGGAATILGGLLYATRGLWAEADAQSAAGLDPKEFKKFKLREVVPINYNSSVFRFDLEHKDQELGLTVASAIVVRAKIDGEEKPVIRPYTPLANDIKGAFDLLVKVYPNGKMSSHIANLKPGDELEIKGPISKIPYTANMKKSIGMIAGGTGLTPMVQVINEILKNPEDKTEVNFVFANIAERDILLKEKLDYLAEKHSNFKVHYVLEQAPKGWAPAAVGFVNEDVVKKFLPAPSKDSMIFVCGPPGMMKAISGAKAPDYTQGEVDGVLKKLGYTKDNVFKF